MWLNITKNKFYYLSIWFIPIRLSGDGACIGNPSPRMKYSRELMSLTDLTSSPSSLLAVWPWGSYLTPLCLVSSPMKVIKYKFTGPQGGSAHRMWVPSTQQRSVSKGHYRSFIQQALCWGTRFNLHTNCQGTAQGKGKPQKIMDLKRSVLPVTPRACL